jgi:MerR family copper efflux transcriptional regulator
MRISDVARESDVGVETIRFYEQKGLIAQPPRPKAGGYRSYPSDVVRRIRFIRSAQLLGFSLTEVADLLQLQATTAAQCVDVRQRAEIKRGEVQTKIDDLKRIRRALDRLIDACPGKGPARMCSILDSINSGELQLGTMTDGENNGRQQAKDRNLQRGLPGM